MEYNFDNITLELVSTYKERVETTRYIEHGARHVNLIDDDEKVGVMYLYENGMPYMFLSLEYRKNNEKRPEEIYYFNRLGDVTRATHYGRDASEKFMFTRNKNKIITEYLDGKKEQSDARFQQNIETIFAIADKVNVQYAPSYRRVSLHPSRKVS